MPYTIADVVDGLRHSRAFFHKHLAGMTDEQWDFKPYAECKSVRETVAHLISDDRAALDSLKSGQEPDYDACQVEEQDREKLLAMVAESHEALLAHIGTAFAEQDLGAETSLWGSQMKVGALGYISSEDYYHAGQVAYIRLATDPAWDYYAAVYGG